MIEVNGTDEQQAALFAAITEAQAEIEPPSKDSSGAIAGKKDYKYASLPGILAAIRPALKSHGLSHHQWHGQTHDVMGVASVRIHNMILHKGGGRLFFDGDSPVERFNSHGHGSANTYGKKLHAGGFWFIAAEDDDDGKASIGTTQNRPQNARQGGYSDSPDNEPSRGSYDASLPFNEEREMLPRNTASGDVNPSTVEALIKNTGFPHKGILGAYLKEKDMLTGYRAEDIAAWLSDNAGASGEELLFAAAAYGAEKLDGEFRDKAEAYAKANRS